MSSRLLANLNWLFLSNPEEPSLFQNPVFAKLKQ
jgi:hypothetical protein